MRAYEIDALLTSTTLSRPDESVKKKGDIENKYDSVTYIKVW